MSTQTGSSAPEKDHEGPETQESPSNTSKYGVSATSRSYLPPRSMSGIFFFTSTFVSGASTMSVPAVMMPDSAISGLQKNVVPGTGGSPALPLTEAVSGPQMPPVTPPPCMGGVPSGPFGQGFPTEFRFSETSAHQKAHKRHFGEETVHGEGSRIPEHPFMGPENAKNMPGTPVSAE